MRDGRIILESFADQKDIFHVETKDGLNLGILSINSDGDWTHQFRGEFLSLCESFSAAMDSILKAENDERKYLWQQGDPRGEK